MVAWTWHVFLQPLTLAKVFALVSCGLWCLTHLYRLTTTFFLRCGLVTVKECRQFDDATFLTVSTSLHQMDIKPQASHSIRAFPGCYFYVFFPGPLPAYNLLHGIPLMVVWAKPEEFRTGRVKELSFLIAPDGRHRGNSLLYTKTNTNIRLEGPYGRDIGIHKYENVIMAAKGMGITGVLPFVLHLLSRYKHDLEVRANNSNEETFRDLTRTVQFFWWLEDNSQELYVQDQLQALESLEDERYVSNRLTKMCSC